MRIHTINVHRTIDQSKVGSALRLKLIRPNGVSKSELEKRLLIRGIIFLPYAAMGQFQIQGQFEIVECD